MLRNNNEFELPSKECCPSMEISTPVVITGKKSVFSLADKYFKCLQEFQRKIHKLIRQYRFL